MKWFRFYNEALHDPKVQSLRPELFKFWVNCLCIASEADERGTLPPIEEIAFIVRLKRTVVERFCVELVVAQLFHTISTDGSVTAQCDVTDGSVTAQWSFTTRFVVHQWKARQPSSDHSKERTSAYRKRASSKSTKADVTAAPPSRKRACDALELDRELIPPIVPQGVTASALPDPVPVPSPGPLSTPARTAEDLALVRKAEALLAADPSTEHLALELGRTHGQPASLATPGWKWIRAAEYITSPSVPAGKRRWPYFLAIVRNLTDADREPSTGPGKPRSLPSTPLPPDVTGIGRGTTKRPRGSLPARPLTEGPRS